MNGLTHAPTDYKLVIFDKDGTLCQNKNDPGAFINHFDEQELIPGVLEKCQDLHRRGVVLAVASNQGGVAFGHLNDGVAFSMVVQARDAISGAYSRHCPFHPDGTEPRYARDSFYRKPRPGMLLAIMVDAEAEPSETLFVGDRDEDLEAARRARCDFAWAWAFFGWEPPDNWADDSDEAREAYFGDAARRG